MVSEAMEAASRNESFQKRERLQKSKDFRMAYKKGTLSKKGALVLYSIPNSLSYNRMGFSISAKNIKKANRRNRIRRLLKEAYRLNKKYLKNGFDMVIVIKKDMGRPISYKVIEPIFLNLVKEAKVLA